MLNLLSILSRSFLRIFICVVGVEPEVMKDPTADETFLNGRYMGRCLSVLFPNSQSLNIYCMRESLYL